jgi:hypothetical protein
MKQNNLNKAPVKTPDADMSKGCVLKRQQMGRDSKQIRAKYP